MTLPKIIQGGMGAAVSGWQLARSVAMSGQIGIVSGTALDLVLVRRLQAGDPGGHMRRALAAFPYPEIAQRIESRYFVEGGKAADKPFKSKPIVGDKNGLRLQELLVASNFTEVWLAKEGHDGIVGVNFLHKIQSPLLASIYGSILANVDIIVVGAGIPVEIPWVIDQLIQHKPVEMKLDVPSAKSGRIHKLTFDPRDVCGDTFIDVKRPLFFPIISSALLATVMVKKSEGQVDGFIIEEPTAGGHNAPPRGRQQLTDEGEPIYGPRDIVDLNAVKKHGLPFYLAGSYGSPERLVHAMEEGAAGIQVGTLFAFCDESGLTPELKKRVIESCIAGTHRVFTDPVASPTGFPFKVVSVEGTLSEASVYEQRQRICDLGYLREAYEKEDETVAWRCKSDVVELFVKDGGDIEDTVGRKCLCNGLMANIGLGQYRAGQGEELALLTCGDALSDILKLMPAGQTSYTAQDVLDYLTNSDAD